MMFGTALTLLLSLATASEAASCDRAKTRRGLFIGTSFTYVNNMPRLVEGIAAGLPGPCVESAMIAVGGATLALHWAADSVAQRIRTGRWTDVVLNDQSTFGEQWSLEGQPRVGTSGAEFTEYAGRFVAEIKAANTRPVLLAHWSADGAPVRDQQALDHIFATRALATGSILAPVGAAVKRMRAAMPAVTPYHADGRHLSGAGSYLEALVLYGTLTGHSPVGATGRIVGPAVEFNRGIVYSDSLVTLVDLPDSLAAELQQLAAAVFTERRGVPSVPAPAPLSAEFPKVPPAGEPIDAATVAGRWRGSSRVLPTPSNEPVEIELVLHPETRSATTPDSVYLRMPPIEMTGPVVWRVEGSQLVVTGSVLPRGRAGRSGMPQPFTIELRAVRAGSVLSGVAHMHQAASPGVPSSFDAVGRFEMRR